LIRGYIGRGAKGRTIFNVDETLISARHGNQYRTLRLTDTLRKAHASQIARLKLLGSVTLFANGDGECIFIAVCIKRKEGSKLKLQIPAPQAINTVRFS
jgi:hypothetical protein